MTTLPFVSIVMPTYNRSAIVAETLDSILQLDYPFDRLEVLVIDDGSKDDTPTILSRFQSKAPFAFLFFRQQNRGPAAARNLGVNKARGEFIAFTDDDCTAHPQWLNELLKGFESEQVGAVGGAVHSRSRNIVARYQEHRQTFAANLSGAEVPPFVITGNSCYRRDTFLSVGGFDEQIKHPGGEDPDLSWRVVASGWMLRYTPKAVVHHLHETSVRDFYRSYYYYGRGAHYVIQKHGLRKMNGSDHEKWIKILSPRMLAYHVKQNRNIAKQPWRVAVAFAILDHVREAAWLKGYSGYSDIKP